MIARFRALTFSRTFFDLLTPYVGYKVAFESVLDGEEGSGEVDFGRSNFLTYLEQGVTFDWRDNILDPRQGIYTSIRIAESLSELGSEQIGSSIASASQTQDQVGREDAPNRPSGVF